LWHRLTGLLPWLALLGVPAIVAALRRRRSRPSIAVRPRPKPRAVAVSARVPDSAPVTSAPDTAAASQDQHGTARDLVTAALDGDAAAVVIVPRATLRMLRPDCATATDTATLAVTATVEDAVTALEAEALHRARLVEEHDVEEYADVAEITALPRFVLITHAGRAQRARLAAAAAHWHAYDIHTVVLGSSASATFGPVAEPPAPSPAATTTGDEPAEPPLAKVQVRVIGEVCVLDRRGKVVSGFRGRAKDLLTYLTVHRDGARVPEILEALWPDATVDRASERLSTEVGNLRRTVRTATGDGSVKAVDNPGRRYVLNRDVLDIDAWQLDQILAGDDPDAPDREARLRAAVALHTGDLGGAATHPWLEAARQRCRQQGITARQRLAEVVAATRPAEAAALLDAAADVDPYSDTLASAAIEAFAALGDTAAVQRRYTHLVAALADIDDQPAASTKTRVETILGGDRLDESREAAA
jgi:DNA-binding SARP family transcriptional activator